MTPVNERIRAKKIRVVGPDGAQLGLMNTKDAIDLAKSRRLDLVEIASKADPPVCKIVDYGKFKYEQSKLKKGSVKSVTRLKEVKFRIGTDEHDYNIKCGRAENFLAAGHKVQIALQFRGRENAHKDLGIVMLNRIKEDLIGMANCDQQPKIAGRGCRMLLAPIPSEQQKRKFKIVKGDLVDDEDDFEDDVDFIEDGEESDNPTDDLATTEEK